MDATYQDYNADNSLKMRCGFHVVANEESDRFPRKASVPGFGFSGVSIPSISASAINLSAAP
jgi:hypothetical protein